VYSRKQMENDLRLAFDDYKNTEMVLDGKKKLLEARTMTLAAAIQKLENVRTQEDTLVDNIGHLRARLHQAQALEAASTQVLLDDGALAEAKEILNRCRRRIEVAAKMVENETGTSPQSIPVEAHDARDISAEVDRHFSGAATALARDSGDDVD
jgi:hypothetical protein